ncbi:AfsR/SARP family transcriptional regulator [Streptomyces hydrogenans]
MNVTPSAQLRLLGPFRLERGGRSIELCRNGQRLLALLSLRESVPRTVLAGTLWPEVTEEHARGSLRTTLWKLPRGELPLVRCRGDVLTVAPSLRVDIHVLTRTALGVMAGCVPQPDHRPPLGLLTGEDLLPGWDEDWVLLERERLRQLRLHALDSPAETLIGQGRTALAMEAAWACIRAEPLRESTHRVVVSSISRRATREKRSVTTRCSAPCRTRNWVSSPRSGSRACSPSGCRRGSRQDTRSPEAPRTTHRHHDSTTGEAMAATATLLDAYRVHAATGTGASVNEVPSPVEGSVSCVTYRGD